MAHTLVDALIGLSILTLLVPRRKIRLPIAA